MEFATLAIALRVRLVAHAFSGVIARVGRVPMSDIINKNTSRARGRVAYPSLHVNPQGFPCWQTGTECGG
jgi:hypothetical protein